MKRRAFITLLGGGAAWPIAARAQRPVRIAKIGHIESGWPSSSPNLLAAFRQGLRELGYRLTTLPERAPPIALLHRPRVILLADGPRLHETSTQYVAQ